MKIINYIIISILLVLCVYCTTLGFIWFVDYNKTMYETEELNYDCNLWVGVGLHTTNSITKAVTIEVNNKTYHLKNNETTLKNNCIFK